MDSLPFHSLSDEQFCDEFLQPLGASNNSTPSSSSSSSSPLSPLPPLLLSLLKPGLPYAAWVPTGYAAVSPTSLNYAVRTDVNFYDGNPAFVGRCYIGEALVPGGARIVFPCFANPFVQIVATWQGDVSSSDDAEILLMVRGRAEWVPASDGDVPANAFPVGQSPTGETIYCARAILNERLVLGRVMESDGACVALSNERHMIPKEVALKNYEVLVFE